ncbi:MAG: hypothetical protein ACI4UV_13645, partial [Victivallales bacterium]
CPGLSAIIGAKCKSHIKAPDDYIWIPRINRQCVTGPSCTRTVKLYIFTEYVSCYSGKQNCGSI